MGDRLAGLRAALTPLVVVIGVAVIAVLLLGAIMFGLATVLEAAFGGGGGGDAGVDVPEASFEVTEEDGELRITHVGDDPVDAEALGIVAHDPRGSWAENDPDAETVEPGDSVTVDATDEHGDPVTAREVRVFWTGADDPIQLPVEVTGDES